MDFYAHNSSFSSISPPGTAATTSEHDFDASLMHMSHTNPHSSYNNSPSIQPEQDVLHYGSSTEAWQMTAALPPNHPQFHDGQPIAHLFTQYNAFNYPSGRPPSYTGSGNLSSHGQLVEPKLTRQGQPPPYHSPGSVPHSRTSVHVHGNQHHGLVQYMQDFMHPSGPDVATGQTFSRKTTAVGSRSATERKHRTIHMETTAPNPLASKLLRDALRELYPHCNSFQESMENLIYTHHLLTKDKFSITWPRGHRFERNEKSEYITRDRVNMQYGDEKPVNRPEMDRDRKSSGSSDETSGNTSDKESEDPVDTSATLDDMEVDTDLGYVSPVQDTQLTPSHDNNPPMEELGKLYACPYNQRDPTAYENRRVCSGSGWPEVRRVKEHIYREHSLPISCERCSEIFENNEDKAAHLRSEPQCQLRYIRYDGCNEEQVRKIKSKKDSHNKSEVQKWEAMYRILFPEETLIPSPFFELRSNYCRRILGKFKNRIITQLPKHIEQEMKPHRSIHPFKKSGEPKIEQIVSKHTNDLFLDFVATEHGLSSVSEVSATKQKIRAEASTTKQRIKMDNRRPPASDSASNLTPNGFATKLPASNSPSNLTPNGFVTKLPARPSRRPADTELSRSPPQSSSSHHAKRRARYEGNIRLENMRS